MNRTHRRIGMVVGAAALAAAAVSPALAQQAGTWDFNARGGVAVPAGKLSDATKVGPTVGLGTTYWIHSRIGLNADGDLALLQGKTVGTVTAPDLNLWHYTGGAIVSLLDPAATRWRAYANVGAGASTYDPRVTGSKTSTRFTSNGGLRLGYQLGRSSNVFVGGQAYLMFTDKTTTGSSTNWNFPIQAGFKLGV